MSDKKQIPAVRYEIQRPNSLTDEQLDRWREYICGPEDFDLTD
jgi:hypothetical protein